MKSYEQRAMSNELKEKNSLLIAFNSPFVPERGLLRFL